MNALNKRTVSVPRLDKDATNQNSSTRLKLLHGINTLVESGRSDEYDSDSSTVVSPVNREKKERYATIMSKRKQPGRYVV
jgi:hypothetical protein